MGRWPSRLPMGAEQVAVAAAAAGADPGERISRHEFTLPTDQVPIPNDNSDRKYREHNAPPRIWERVYIRCLGSVCQREPHTRRAPSIIHDGGSTVNISQQFSMVVMVPLE